MLKAMKALYDTVVTHKVGWPITHRSHFLLAVPICHTFSRLPVLKAVKALYDTAVTHKVS